jgi:D-glycero-alpha-D-manno-heptose-7-phosphate kinase
VIVARAPVRISLGGGGTDLPSYASQFGGYCISAAIDKYVYVVLNPRFDKDSIRVASATTEIVSNLDDMKHPLYRECLRLVGVRGGVELCSMADVPANTGLGSSSSFTVACLAALHAYRGESPSAAQLAEEACTVEIERLGEPIGKQDQYLAAYGGLREMDFSRFGLVSAPWCRVLHKRALELERRLLIFWTGIERKASEVLTQQQEAILSGAALERMHAIKRIGEETREILAHGDLDQYGELLHQHWMAKRDMVGAMTNPAIDGYYQAARDAGALGGKLMGAGGGGFLLLYAREKDAAAVRVAMGVQGLRELAYRLGGSGAMVVHKENPG